MSVQGSSICRAFHIDAHAIPPSFVYLTSHSNHTILIWFEGVFLFLFFFERKKGGNYYYEEWALSCCLMILVIFIIGEVRR